MNEEIVEIAENILFHLSEDRLSHFLKKLGLESKIEESLDITEGKYMLQPLFINNEDEILEDICVSIINSIKVRIPPDALFSFQMDEKDLFVAMLEDDYKFILNSPFIVKRRMIEIDEEKGWDDEGNWLWEFPLEGNFEKNWKYYLPVSLPRTEAHENIEPDIAVRVSQEKQRVHGSGNSKSGTGAHENIGPVQPSVNLSPQKFKKITKEAIAAYRIMTMGLASKQEEIGKLLEKEFGKPFPQPQVSRLLRKAEDHIQRHGVLPSLEEVEKASMQTMNPSDLDLGARQDGRKHYSREE